MRDLGRNITPVIAEADDAYLSVIRIHGNWRVTSWKDFVETSRDFGESRS